MSENTVAIETSLLVEEDCEHCLERLQRLLEHKNGIARVHLRTQPTQLCLHFDPNLVTLASVERMAREAGSQLSERYRHQRILISGGSSADAAASLERHLQEMEGVLHVAVNHAAGSVFLAYDSELCCLSDLRREIENRGFDLMDEPGRPHACSGGHDHAHAHSHSHLGCGGHGEAPSFLPDWIGQRWTFLLVALAGLFLLAGWLGQTYLNWPPSVTLGLFLLSYLAGGYDVATHALPGLLRGRFDTDILMLAAAAGAALLGEWAEGAFLLFLFALGHAGEHYALDRARNAIDSLGELLPTTALLQQDGDLHEVEVEDLTIGQTVLVRPGDRIPVDGIVRKGASAVDQSPITGESVPVKKTVEDEVFAGTINLGSALEVSVTTLAVDNTLARVMQLVSEAQEQKGPTQALTQRFTSRFVPAVLLLTVLVILLPPLLEWLTWRESFYRGMLLLVAASPCALALGTPATVLAGIGQAARNGVLIKGGAHLESLGTVTTVAFDKTGTLTEGEFRVQEIACLGETTEEELLVLAASVERHSNHPLARAILAEARRQKLTLRQAEGSQNLPGLGVRSLVEGEVVELGSPRLIPETEQDFRGRMAALEEEGRTLVVVRVAEQTLGALALADTPREGAPEALRGLRAQGIATLVMLTGDNGSVARRIGEQLGLDRVVAELLPEQKLGAVRELQQTPGTVLAMVGDGVNDAPALAGAQVGIAMGTAGTAVALETADVALMGDDLEKLPFAIGLSRFARRVIKQNLALALGVIVLLVVTSVLGWVELSWAVAVHEGSTLVVVFNALRLLRFTGSSRPIAK